MSPLESDYDKTINKEEKKDKEKKKNNPSSPNQPIWPIKVKLSPLVHPLPTLCPSLLPSAQFLSLQHQWHNSLSPLSQPLLPLFPLLLVSLPTIAVMPPSASSSRRPLPHRNNRRAALCRVATAATLPLLASLGSRLRRGGRLTSPALLTA
jgi:hypothetical protein